MKYEFDHRDPDEQEATKLRQDDRFYDEILRDACQRTLGPSIVVSKSVRNDLISLRNVSPILQTREDDGVYVVDRRGVEDLIADIWEYSTHCRPNTALRLPDSSFSFHTIEAPNLIKALVEASVYEGPLPFYAIHIPEANILK
jgi:hypothetical protein